MSRFALAVGLLVLACCVGLAAELAPMPRPAGPADAPMLQLQAEAEAARKAVADLEGRLTKVLDETRAAADSGQKKADTAWMLTSSALVMLMVPGLALFYGGMVRRKNVLSTMMQSVACLGVVGLYWLAVGYSLAFGKPLLTASVMGVTDGGLVGWDWNLVFLKGVTTDQTLPGTNVPVLVHVLFQGMFAIITPALISGAVAERVRFLPFCLFSLLWVTVIYCPLAHMVWGMDWYLDAPLDATKGLGGSAVGLLGKLGALDFAGGTVVHIAAGTAGLAGCLLLRRRDGYPHTVTHPNSMVLTLVGAGLLWFGWFGFNGGSGTASGPLAAAAFAATQAAAAAAGVGWMVVEWLHKGKPTALGLASGVVAGLVAVTPASGYVVPWAGVLIGLAAALVCYVAVWAKSKLGYDDSLDAFGVHGVGGFLGAVLTGVFCATAVNPAGADGPVAVRGLKARAAEIAATALPAAERAGQTEKAAKLKAEYEAANKAVDAAAEKGSQVWVQLKAAVFAAGFSFVLSAGLILLTSVLTGGRLLASTADEADGLDRVEHGEVGFDFGFATESVTRAGALPRAASVPLSTSTRYDLAVEGPAAADLIQNWSALCQPSDAPPDPDFLAVYPHVTTVSGGKFRFRGGDPTVTANRLESLFRKRLPGQAVRVVKL